MIRFYITICYSTYHPSPIFNYKIKSSIIHYQLITTINDYFNGNKIKIALKVFDYL